jgi:hypothetical protein
VEPRRHVSIIVLPAVLRSKVHVRSTWNPSFQWDAEKRRTVPDKICIALSEELTWSHLPDASLPLPSSLTLFTTLPRTEPHQSPASVATSKPT